MVSTFLKQNFFVQILLISIFISGGGVHKSGNEQFVTLSNVCPKYMNVKLTSVMPFCIYYCKRKLNGEIRHQLSIKKLKFCKDNIFELFNSYIIANDF